MFEQVNDYFDVIFEYLLCALRKKQGCGSTPMKAIGYLKIPYLS